MENLTRCQLTASEQKTLERLSTIITIGIIISISLLIAVLITFDLSWLAIFAIWLAIDILALPVTAAIFFAAAMTGDSGEGIGLIIGMIIIWAIIFSYLIPFVGLGYQLIALLF